MANNYYFKVNKGIALTPQTTIPTTAKKGDLYFDDTLNLLQSYNGTSWNDVGGGLTAVVDDLSPQLGGNLDANGHNIYLGINVLAESASNANISFPTTDSIKLESAVAGNYFSFSNSGISSILSGNVYFSASTNIDLEVGNFHIKADINSAKLYNNLMKVEVDASNINLDAQSGVINILSNADFQSTKQIVNLPAANTAGNAVEYTQFTTAIDAAGWTMSASTSLTAGGTITINTSLGQQVFRVASSSGAVTLSTTPFGTSAPNDGAAIRLIGTSDTNTVQISFNDAAKGCLVNGTAVLRRGNVIEFQFVQGATPTDDRYYEVARNF